MSFWDNIASVLNIKGQAPEEGRLAGAGGVACIAGFDSCIGRPHQLRRGDRRIAEQVDTRLGLAGLRGEEVQRLGDPVTTAGLGKVIAPEEHIQERDRHRVGVAAKHIRLVDEFSQRAPLRPRPVDQLDGGNQVAQGGGWVEAPVQAATVQKLEDIILTRARDLRKATTEQ